jgi:hypothetical protein
MAGNVMAAGDSAGRGLLAGKVLDAWVGRPAVPERLLSGRAAAQEATRLPASIPSGPGA